MYYLYPCIHVYLLDITELDELAIDRTTERKIVSNVVLSFGKDVPSLVNSPSPPFKSSRKRNLPIFPHIGSNQGRADMQPSATSKSLIAWWSSWSFVRPSVRPSVRQFVRPSIHQSVHPFIRSLVRSFIRSFFGSLLRRLITSVPNSLRLVLEIAYATQTRI